MTNIAVRFSISVPLPSLADNTFVAVEKLSEIHIRNRVNHKSFSPACSLSLLRIR
jgi:hypothetical protein